MDTLEERVSKTIPTFTLPVSKSLQSHTLWLWLLEVWLWLLEVLARPSGNPIKETLSIKILNLSKTVVGALHQICFSFSISLLSSLSSL